VNTLLSPKYRSPRSTRTPTLSTSACWAVA
jgi:hypothetical protein